MTVALKENAVFRRLYYKGRSAGSRLLVLYCRENHLGFNRVGLTVGVKLGHAVVRNRMRRRLREIYRLHESRFRPGYDIVVVARGAAVEADFASLTRAYLHCARHLGLLLEETR